MCVPELVRAGLVCTRMINSSQGRLGKASWTSKCPPLSQTRSTSKPKTLDVPTILPSKFAHLYELDHEALQRILPKDVPMRYSMKPGAPLLGLRAMSQDYPSEVVPNIFPQSFSNPSSDY